MSQQVLFAASPEETAVATKTSSLGHNARLLEVLGDGRDWEYTGDCNERQHADGKCACGHTGIRFEFLIRNKFTKNTVIVGSTCIEHYTEVNPEMVAGIAADVEKFEAAAAARKKAAKELAQDQEVQTLLAKYTDLAYDLDRRLAEGAESFEYKAGYGSNMTKEIGWRQVKRVSSAIYYGWHDCGRAATRWHQRKPGQTYPTAWKQYKLKSAFIRCIKEQIAHVENLSAGELWQAPRW